MPVNIHRSINSAFPFQTTPSSFQHKSNNTRSRQAANQTSNNPSSLQRKISTCLKKTPTCQPCPTTRMTAPDAVHQASRVLAALVATVPELVFEIEESSPGCIIGSEIFKRFHLNDSRTRVPRLVLLPRP
jgi:hypothetical protein